MAKEIRRLVDSLLEYDSDNLQKVTREYLEAGIESSAIMNELSSGMAIVGEKMAKGEVYLPEVIMAATAMQASVAIVKPFLVDKKQSSLGTVLIGTVKGDLHDIGKNIVAMMLGSSFEVIDLGYDVSPEAFVEATKKHSPDVLGMSCMLTTTMPSMKETVDLLIEANLKDKVKVICGGAPVTAEFTESIGADGYAFDASEAITVCKKLVL